MEYITDCLCKFAVHLFPMPSPSLLNQKGKFCSFGIIYWQWNDNLIFNSMVTSVSCIGILRKQFNRLTITINVKGGTSYQYI